MNRILVTGATGNVGKEVAEALRHRNVSFMCGVRNLEKARAEIGHEFDLIKLDFADRSTFELALEGVDRVFLNYPPETPFEDFHAFIRQAKEQGICHLTYLSIKDVQYLPFVPHFKNEREIRNSGLSYTFLRAGYFTQNLNMFLLNEIVEHDRIFVPAGKGKTSFVDLRDSGELAAITLLEPESHCNECYVLTGLEALDFFEVASIMTEVLGRTIKYTNPNLKTFKSYFLGKGMEERFVNLVGGLHTFTKLGMAKGIKPDLERLLGRDPIPVRQYVVDYRGSLKRAINNMSRDKNLYRLPEWTRT
ncbi:SDR family oxidoreductase [Paenibacillus illinoisensis]|uniref:SDR family oxidoreductase n=1 Tax=Paenibacillus illinoisensis TaxID=59845 RepID=UPI0030181A20